jgi:ribosome-binding factor A
VAGSQRQGRVARAITEVMAEEIGRLKDPRVVMTSVLRTEVTPDLRRARVHISVMAEGRQRAAALMALRGAVGHLRSRLGERLGLRYTPELVLVPDDAIAEVVRLSGILHEASEGGGRGSEPGPDPAPGGDP